jgi:hypothetical protein
LLGKAGLLYISLCHSDAALNAISVFPEIVEMECNWTSRITCWVLSVEFHIFWSSLVLYLFGVSKIQVPSAIVPVDSFVFISFGIHICASFYLPMEKNRFFFGPGSIVIHQPKEKLIE